MRISAEYQQTVRAPDAERTTQTRETTTDWVSWSVQKSGPDIEVRGLSLVTKAFCKECVSRVRAVSCQGSPATGAVSYVYDGAQAIAPGQEGVVDVPGRSTVTFHFSGCRVTHVSIGTMTVWASDVSRDLGNGWHMSTRTRRVTGELATACREGTPVEPAAKPLDIVVVSPVVPDGQASRQWSVRMVCFDASPACCSVRAPWERIPDGCPGFVPLPGEAEPVEIVQATRSSPAKRGKPTPKPTPERIEPGHASRVCFGAACCQREPSAVGCSNRVMAPEALELLGGLSGHGVVVPANDADVDDAYGRCLSSDGDDAAVVCVGLALRYLREGKGARGRSFLRRACAIRPSEMCRLVGIQPSEPAP